MNRVTDFGRRPRRRLRSAGSNPTLLHRLCVWVLPFVAVCSLGGALYLGLTAKGAYPSAFNIHRLRLARLHNMEDDAGAEPELLLRLPTKKQTFVDGLPNSRFFDAFRSLFNYYNEDLSLGIHTKILLVSQDLNDLPQASLLSVDSHITDNEDSTLGDGRATSNHRLVCLGTIVLVSHGVPWLSFSEHKDIILPRRSEAAMNDYQLYRRSLPNGATKRRVTPLPAIPRLPAKTAFNEGQGNGEFAVVLGNMPLDDCVISLASVRNVLKAVEYWRTHPQVTIVLSGGKLFGSVSEAEMMALVALDRGVPREQLLLEKESHSTRDNAKLSAAVVESRLSALNLLQPSKVLVVSKPEHLKWAMPMFHEHGVFQKAISLASEVRKSEIIDEMRGFLKYVDRESDIVRRRLHDLERGIKGID